MLTHELTDFSQEGLSKNRQTLYSLSIKQCYPSRKPIQFHYPLTNIKVVKPEDLLYFCR